jgi:hypothetical protein
MATSHPSPVLGDDHIDLLVTAAARWGVLVSRTVVALAAESPRHHILTASENEVGQTLRQANVAAVRWLGYQGRGRIADRRPPTTYNYRPVDAVLEPVEVIKAVQAAQAMCHDDPTWNGGSAQRFLSAVLTAATHRLDGYPQAPWSWTRPEHRGGPPVGVALDSESRPPVAGLEWVTPASVPRWWSQASLIVVRTGAALQIPAGLPDRDRVVLLVTNDETHNQTWLAVEALRMAARVFSWPEGADGLESEIAQIAAALKHAESTQGS